MSSETIVGIDLGTTNSEVAVVRNGHVEVLGENGEKILPSVVGLDPAGQLLVGTPARNQWILAPERTVRSIKRKMGQDVKVSLGSQRYTPQEISAIILRTLKERAERQLGHPVHKAVITVPAFFNEIQREATREAGELAGLEVVRIINEPTAAALTYEAHSDRQERLLVYDLGGGTFDVSIVEVEHGVVEVLASHGDTHLGGDDFDQLLLDYVCDGFFKERGVDLRQSPVSKSRMLQAVEAAKIRLSDEAFANLVEEFIAEKGGTPLHLRCELARREYEVLIEQLLKKTLECVDRSLSDARLHARQIDKVILVGGASRTPLVRQLLEERLGRPVHAEVHPELCVAMGAAIQGAMIAGMDAGPVLVDITPHTLGIAVLGLMDDELSPYVFSPVIKRNTPLPASRSEVYHTARDKQKIARIEVYQGESPDVRFNELVGEFDLKGLAEVKAGNPILVRFDLDLDGILKVTAQEKATGLEKQLVIDNQMSRFRTSNRESARQRIDAAFLPPRAGGFDGDGLGRGWRRAARRGGRPCSRGGRLSARGGRPCSRGGRPRSRGGRPCSRGGRLSARGGTLSDRGPGTARRTSRAGPPQRRTHRPGRTHRAPRPARRRPGNPPSGARDPHRHRQPLLRKGQPTPGNFGGHGVLPPGDLMAAEWWIRQVVRAGGFPEAQPEWHPEMARFSSFSAYASTLCCPTCRARQEWTDQCRRCRSDLRLLRRVAGHCRHARAQALSALDEGRWFEALAHARRAFALNPQPESRRLLAVCYLLADRPAEALALAASESDPPSAR